MNNTIIQVCVAAITIIVLKEIVFKFISSFKKNTIAEIINITKAPGSDSLMTFARNLPLTGLLLGSLTNTKDGIPIANASMMISCDVEIG